MHLFKYFIKSVYWCRKFGDIDNVWLASYPPLFAFVTFKAKEDAADALKEMNNA